MEPFRIDIPETDLDDLKERLARTRWPADSPDGGWSRGVPLARMRELADHWRDGYDWRAQESALNEIPQFRTTIDGQDIHFLHARSSAPDALPLLMTHGWPSSPFEFANVIGPLTESGFHVVAPSLPGYGFSNPVREAGWGNLFRVAQAWMELMTRLEYDRYAVHGTDAGSGVAGILGMIDGQRVVGTHIAGTVAAMPFGPPLELDGLPPADRERAERFNAYREDGIGYLHMQATRPQTLAYALNDSPVAQLAWIAEKLHEWTAEELDRDLVLTIASLSWFTGSGASSAHATYEGMQAFRQMAAQGGGHGEAPPGPPQAVAVFAADTTIRSVMDPEGAIDRWTEYDRGGHFPGLEVPDLLAHDLREFFAAYR